MPPLPHKTSPPTPQVVEEIFTREGQLFELVVAGRVLRTTPEHPFFVEGQGWTPAGELQPGQLLSTATGGWLPVELITNAHQSVPVYNFSVSNSHTYFIAPRDAAHLASSFRMVSDLGVGHGDVPSTCGVRAMYAAFVGNSG